MYNCVKKYVKFHSKYVDTMKSIKSINEYLSQFENKGVKKQLPE